MDFNVSADPPHVVEFRKRSRRLARRSSSKATSTCAGRRHGRPARTRRNINSAAAWPKNSAPRAGCFRFIRKNTAAPSSPSIIRWCSKPSCSNMASICRIRFTPLARIVAPVLIRWGTEEQKAEFLAADHPGANLRLASSHRTAWRQRHRQLPDQGDPRRRPLCRQRPESHGRPPSAAGLISGRWSAPIRRANAMRISPGCISRRISPASRFSI